MAIDQGSLRYGQGGFATSVETRNRVLRNTYWLLALSLIPTVIGAWVGVSTGFTFFAGSPGMGLIGAVLGLSNGAALIMYAFGGTAVVFAVMASIATTSKRDFSGMGKWLMIGFVVIFLAAIANIWLQMPALMLTISSLAIIIFSLFILYDLQRVVNGGETNYITATLSVYISVYNVFTNLLALLGIAGGNND